jgi:WD40 repeat protein
MSNNDNDRSSDTTQYPTPSVPPPSATLDDRDLPRTAPAESATPPLTVVPGGGSTERRVLRLAGYEILGELGRGGMGVVYRARHLKLGHEVALKMILSGGHAGEQELARFQLEAAAVAKLHHPNIVPIQEFGDHEGNPFFSLEFVDGGSLAARLKQGPLPCREAATLVEKLAQAMQHAHEHGIVHRDLKPANVLLTKEGEPKVTDFGLAKQLGADDGLSQTGSVLGTPAYMAPEQAEGRVRDVGAATDVYALGMILYECLTGQVAFKGMTLHETLEMVSRREPTPLRRLTVSVPRDLETVCLRCLEKDPKKRYQTAADLSDDLGRFLRGEPVAARPVGRLERGWRWCRRNPAVASLMTAVAATLLLGTGVATYFAVVANRNATEAGRNAETARQESERADGEATEARSQQAEAERQRQTAEQRGAEAERQRQTAEQRGAEAVRLQQETAKLLQRTKNVFLTSQLLRAAAVSDRNPEEARRLLLDQTACPPDVRDFTWHLLRERTERLRAGLFGHRNAVVWVVFSPDGKTLASASKDRTIKLWDVAGEREIATLEGHTDWVNAVCFNRDGTLLASAGADGTVRLWDVATQRERRVLNGHAGGAWSVAFAPDGKMLASGGADGAIRLWDVESGQERFPSQGMEAVVRSVAFRADGKRVVGGDSAGMLRFRDAGTGEEQPAIKAHDGPVGWVAFSADGKILTSAGKVRANAEEFQEKFDEIRFWNPETHLSIRTLRINGFRDHFPIALSADGNLLAHASRADSVDLFEATGELRASLPTTSTLVGVGFSPDGRTLAGGDSSGRVLLWDTAPKAERLTVESKGSKIEEWNRALVAYSADGRTLFIGARGRLALFDPTTGAPKEGLPGGMHWEQSAAISPDGRLYATVKGKTIRLLELPGGKERAVLAGHDRPVAGLAFSPDGSLLASVSPGIKFGDPKEIKVWDMKTGQERATLPSTDGFLMAFSPDGKTLATAGQQRKTWYNYTGRAIVYWLRLWDLPSGQERCAVRIETPSITSIAFSPDGATLAIGRWSNDIALLDTTSGQMRSRLVGHRDYVLAVTFSPDGKTLASASRDATIKLWDPVIGQERATLRGHAYKVLGLGFAPDSKSLASLDETGTVKVWGRSPTRYERTIRVHTSPVWGVAISPDSRTVASISSDGVIKMRDTVTNQERLTVSGPTGDFGTLAFSPDGKTLACGGEDGYVRLLDVADGKERRRLYTTGRIVCITFSPEGRRLACAAAKAKVAQVVVWDVATGEQVSSCPGFLDECPFGVVFAPDGKTVYSPRILFTPDGRTAEVKWYTNPDTIPIRIAVSDPGTGQEVALLPGYVLSARFQGELIGCLTVSRDGKLLAIGSPTGVTVRDRESGRKVAELPTLRPVLSLAFSPDGTLLAAAEQEGMVRVWDVASGQEKSSLRCGTAFLSLAFSPDGGTLYAGDAEGTLHAWEVTAFPRERKR